MGLIRTKTFLKYAKINLEEAQELIKANDLETGLKRIEDALNASIKAVSSALPHIKKDFSSLKEKEFLNFALDLSMDEERPKMLTKAIFETKRLLDKKNEPESALFHARKAFEILYEMFGIFERN